MKIRGMTFIEVLIAIVIVGIILSGMLTSLNFAGKYTRHNANKTMALNYAQGLMEEIRNASYLENASGPDLNDYDENIYDDIYDDYDNKPLYQKDGVDIQATRSVKIKADDDPNDDIFKSVSVRISWDWLGRSYNETINTLRYNY